MRRHVSAPTRPACSFVSVLSFGACVIASMQAGCCQTHRHSSATRLIFGSSLGCASRQICQRSWHSSAKRHWNKWKTPVLRLAHRFVCRLQHLACHLPSRAARTHLRFASKSAPSASSRSNFGCSKIAACTAPLSSCASFNAPAAAATRRFILSTSSRSVRSLRRGQ